MKAVVVGGLVSVLLLTEAAAADDFEATIVNLIDQHRAAEALPLLAAWKQRAGERDPQYWVALANVLFAEAQTTIRDESKVGSERGARGTATARRYPTSYDAAKVARADAVLVEATARFPHRLDLPLGRAFMAKESHHLAGELVALRALVAVAMPLPAGTAEFGDRTLDESGADAALGVLNDYASDHYRDNDLAAVLAIGTLTTELFPEKPHGYNLVALHYLAQGDYVRNKEWLARALSKNPQDPLVLTNLARCEEHLENKPLAMAHYRAAIALSNDAQQIARAKDALRRLGVKR